MQMHIDVEFPDDMINGFQLNMQRYGELGIHVHITELDVKCKPNSDSASCKNEWNDELREKQG